MPRGLVSLALLSTGVCVSAAQPLLLVRPVQPQAALLVRADHAGPFAVHSWALPSSVCPHRLAALMGLAAAVEAEEAAVGGEWQGRTAQLASVLQGEDGPEEPAPSPPSPPSRPAAADWAWLALCAACGAAFTCLAVTAKAALADARRARPATPPSLLEPLAPGDVDGAVVANPAYGAV